jgi:signal transduction histidine kinase
MQACGSPVSDRVPPPGPEPEEGGGTGAVEEAAQRALLERPSLSIRTRIALGFLLLVVLGASTAVTSWMLLSEIEQKLQLLVIVDRLTVEVQQARRFEKNYFLYGTNLPDALEHTRQARQLLSAHMARGARDATLTDTSLGALARQLDDYESLMVSLAQRSTDSAGLSEVAARVREHGARTTSMVLEMQATERRSVVDMLGHAKRVPLIWLLATLLLSLVVAGFLARQMLAPLTRLVNATQRIAAGDFTPLMPARRYRDEFSNLAMAINRMTQELEHRYSILVESHKLRAVGTLTAGIAHELNNPLNNISLTATTLRQFCAELTEAERIEMLDDLVSQVERSQVIVRNLLDFTRQSEAVVRPLDMRAVVEDAVGLAQNQLRFHGCTVEVDVPHGLPPVHGDRNLLIQMLLNLMLNAVDAMDRGGRMTVRVVAGREPGFLAIDVADTGTGIPAHLLRSIFDPFFTTKPTGRGTGLGLSMSQGIARKHGGDLRVSSQVGAGSTFTVLLPVTPVLADLPATAV